MTTRIERIKRRNAKRIKSYFRVQRLSGMGLILVGCLTALAGSDYTLASCLAASVGGYLTLTHEKVLKDFNDYESEE